MNKEKTAVITGITGQDGAYLAKLLLSKGKPSSDLCIDVLVRISFRNPLFLTGSKLSC